MRRDALAVPGVRKVIEMPPPKPPYTFQPWGGIAVVADHTWAAMRGRAALDVTWDHGPNASYDSDAVPRGAAREGGVGARNGRAQGRRHRGRAEERRTDRRGRVPRAAPAAPADGAARRGGARQRQHAARSGRRRRTRRPRRRRSRACSASRRTRSASTSRFSAAASAASRRPTSAPRRRCSREQLGAPVRVQFTREDDVRHDYFNTVSTNRLTAGLDANGTRRRRGATARRSRRLAACSAAPAQARARRSAAGRARSRARGAERHARRSARRPRTRASAGCGPSTTSSRPSRSARSSTRSRTRRRPIPRDVWLELIGPPRTMSLADLGVEKLPNYGQPLDKHPVDAGRLRNVIERVTELAGWRGRQTGGRASASPRTAASSATRPSSRRSSSVANGSIAVDEVWVAFDAGTVVNTDRVRAQMEGSVIFGMSLALYGGITMKDGAIEQDNFRGGGRIVRIGEAPRRIYGRSRGQHRGARRRRRAGRAARGAGDRERGVRAHGETDSRAPIVQIDSGLRRAPRSDHHRQPGAPLALCWQPDNLFRVSKGVHDSLTAKGLPQPWRERRVGAHHFLPLRLPPATHQLLLQRPAGGIGLINSLHKANLLRFTGRGVFLANSSVVMASDELLVDDRIGRLVLGFFATVGALAVFAGRAVIEAFRPPYDVAEILRHLHHFGLRSTPLIVTSGFAIGIVLSMHTRASLERFGAESMIPAGLAIAMIRETGPLTAGLLVSGRVGAGIGAEIGAMRVTEQIDALEASAVDAFKYLVVTRVIACMIAMPLLTTMMNSPVSSADTSREALLSGMSWQLYFDRSFTYIGFSDLIPATLKTVVFGFLIAIVGGYLGFTTVGGPKASATPSTRSVVMASMLIILSNVILVRIIFFFYPPGAG